MVMGWNISIYNLIILQKVFYRQSGCLVHKIVIMLYMMSLFTTPESMPLLGADFLPEGITSLIICIEIHYYTYIHKNELFTKFLMFREKQYGNSTQGIDYNSYIWQNLSQFEVLSVLQLGALFCLMFFIQASLICLL